MHGVGGAANRFEPGFWCACVCVIFIYFYLNIYLVITMFFIFMMFINIPKEFCIFAFVWECVKTSCFLMFYVIGCMGVGGEPFDPNIFNYCSDRFFGRSREALDVFHLASWSRRNKSLQQNLQFVWSWDSYPFWGKHRMKPRDDTNCKQQWSDINFNIDGDGTHHLEKCNERWRILYFHCIIIFEVSDVC